MKSVSVVVATYRRDEDLKRALESLAIQDYSDMEIVLVDDNGIAEWNDKVFVAVDEFRKKHPDADLNFIINKPNQGSAKTRNIGIEAAKGEYVTFLDDDDVYLPGKVRKQTEFMENGGYDYSITDLILYDENGREIDRRIRNYIKDFSQTALTRYHLKYHMTGTDTMMFKKEYLVKIGGFAPIDVGDEFYLMQKAVDGGGKFGYLPECDVKAYVHTGEGGLSSGESKISGENALFRYKKTYFDKLSSQDVRYIKVRHYAVLAFASIRMRKVFSAFKYAMLGFAVSPAAFAKLLKER